MMPLLPLFALSGLASAASLELASPDPVILKTPEAQIHTLQAGADGRLAASSGEDVWLWGPGSTQIERVLSGKGSRSIALDADGRVLAATKRLKSEKRLKGVYDGSIRFWNLAKMKEIDEVEPEDTVVFSADGSKAALFISGTFAGDTLRVRDMKRNKVRKVWTGPGKCHPTGSAFQPWDCEGIMGVGLSPDGSKALIVRRFRYDWEAPAEGVLVVDTASGETLRSYKDCQDTDRNKAYGAGYAVYSRDGRYLAYGGAHGYTGYHCGVVVREAGTGVILWKATDAVHSLAFSADGARLLAVAAEMRDAPGPLTVWDTATGARLLPPTSEPVTEFALSPDGRALYLHPAGKAEFWAYRLKGAPPTPAAAAAPQPTPAPEAVESVDAPPAYRAPVDPDALAVVVGIERYRQTGIPPVEYAASDAKTVQTYLTRSMGFDPKNVVLLANEQATKTDLEKYLGPWLENRATEKSRVFVYYAGHGSPDPRTGEAYLMPFEGDPAYTKVTGYPLSQLYKTLAALPAKSVVVALDSCFSGAGSRSVIAAGARPLVNVKTAEPEGSTVVLAAAAGDQISGGYPEGGHGLMTYFLLKGLRGAADADGDGKISARELYDYLRPAVEREARRRNSEQTPVLQGLTDAQVGPELARTR